jgi:hypothetical protein
VTAVNIAVMLLSTAVVRGMDVTADDVPETIIPVGEMEVLVLFDDQDQLFHVTMSDVTFTQNTSLLFTTVAVK